MGNEKIDANVVRETLQIENSHRFRLFSQYKLIQTISLEQATNSNIYKHIVVVNIVAHTNNEKSFWKTEFSLFSQT